MKNQNDLNYYCMNKMNEQGKKLVEDLHSIAREQESIIELLELKLLNKELKIIEQGNQTMLTTKQKQALKRIYDRYSSNENSEPLTESYRDFRKNRVFKNREYVAVQLPHIFLGIEYNGYTHS